VAADQIEAGASDREVAKRFRVTRMSVAPGAGCRWPGGAEVQRPLVVARASWPRLRCASWRRCWKQARPPGDGMRTSAVPAPARAEHGRQEPEGPVRAVQPRTRGQRGPGPFWPPRLCRWLRKSR